MSDLVRYEIKDAVAILTVDNPPVNALSAAVWEAIDEAVARANADARAEAIVLTGAGSTFMAGADIRVFDLLKTREDSLARTAGIHAILKRLEDSTRPLVAAIHGNALGGGLEVAMACHFRIATNDAMVGQPEVLLGIIPGAGGTQRLPRLAGVGLALEMCTQGRPLTARKALAAGIIDQVIDDLLPAAIAFAKARAKAGELRRTRDLPIKPEDVTACDAARAALGKPTRGTAAPHAAVDAIEAALTLPFDAGSQRERQLSAACVVSIESKALRHMFFAEREAAKVPDIPKDTPVKDIRRAAVVGA
jgi:3-hydroxyacyl-CoA dehydrogenase